MNSTKKTNSQMEYEYEKVESAKIAPLFHFRLLNSLDRLIYHSQVKLRIDVGLHR